jgi:hypothetical protein
MLDAGLNAAGSELELTLRQQNLRKLVRKIGQPGEQLQLLLSEPFLCWCNSWILAIL